MKKKLSVTLLLITAAMISGCSFNFGSNTGRLPVRNPAPNETASLIEKNQTSENTVAPETAATTSDESETASWKIYDDSNVGFSFKYPSDVILLDANGNNADPEKMYLKVELKEIGKAEGPMDLSEADAKKNIEALASGKFGVDYDFPLAASKKVKAVGFLFAEDFMVLSRFEVCNVALERKLLFYFNNKQILITLYGPVEKLKKSMPEFFRLDKNNCGAEQVWDFTKQDGFYAKLIAKTASSEIQQWFDRFDAIAETITFAHR